MEEEKKFNNPNPNGASENGGRRKRKRPRNGHGGKDAKNANVNNENNANNANNEKNMANNQGKQAGKNQKPNQSMGKNVQNQQKQNVVQPQQKNQNGGNKEKAVEQKSQKNARKNNNEQPKKEENRKDTYLYALDGNLYVNLTNKCSNGCDFCVRNERSSYFGNYLWIRHGDPTAEKVISVAKGMGDLSKYKEVVFCGFGEPTYKMSEMIALCDFFHEKGLSTRLNTNGQGEMINKRDITEEMKGKIDFVNVSLNASCAEKYQKICRSQYGENGFGAMLEFAKHCKKAGIPVRFSIVDCIGEEEVEACKRLAGSMGIPLHVRKYIAES